MPVGGPKLIRSQSGQMVVETILIIVLLLGFAMMASNYFNKHELMKGLVLTPWQSMAGMLQNGAWGSPSSTNQYHPAAYERHLSYMGESAK
jgi:hypothetical protein